LNPCFVEYPSRDVLRCAIGIGDEELAERHSIGLPLCEDFVGGLKGELLVGNSRYRIMNLLRPHVLLFLEADCHYVLRC
jgi:hypothetical protein